MTEDFQVFIKPVGARCNLKCGYCYYLEKGELYGTGNQAMMSDETLEICIKQHYSASSDDTVMFTWHGGEPLLAGLPFYQKAVSLQKKHLPLGKRFLNGIQTNGTLITKDWCEFFNENDFSVGISIDGTENLHNAMRRAQNDVGSFQETLEGYLQLRMYGITTEILCVVSSNNVGYPLEVYDFFKRLDVRYITFLPLVEHSAGQVSQASVPALAFGHFLSAIFDEWVQNDIGVVKIQIFEEALRTAFHQEHTLCIFKERCGAVPVIEHNGDVYPCDHYVDANRGLGNINDHPLTYFLNHPKQQAFGESKRNTLPTYCVRCDVRDMCNGECPKNRFITTPDGEPGLNYLCEGYRYFFKRCQPFIRAVSEAWKPQK